MNDKAENPSPLAPNQPGAPAVPALGGPNPAPGMRPGLSVPRVNRFFLYYLLLALVLGGLPIPGIPSTVAALVYYIPVFIIAIVMSRMDKVSFRDAFGFRSLNPKSLALAAVACFLVHPVGGLVASLTNLVFPSMLEMAKDDLFNSGNMAVTLFGVAMIPAFFEEFLVRGGVLGSYMSTGRVRAAVLLSALVFGLMHMNATQFFYATIIGIVLGLLYALTGSIWPGVLFHLLNNGVNTFAKLMDQKGYGNVIDIVYPIFRGFSDPLHAVILVGAALIGLPLAWLCLRRIARIEGTTDILDRFLHGEPASAPRPKLVTVPMIICFVIMVGMSLAVLVGTILKLGPQG